MIIRSPWNTKWWEGRVLVCVCGMDVCEDVHVCEILWQLSVCWCIHIGFSCNVGCLVSCVQSTLFNALVENGNAAAANYPFCTIEPNTGIVMVPDERMKVLSAISGSKELVSECMCSIAISNSVPLKKCIFLHYRHFIQKGALHCTFIF